MSYCFLSCTPMSWVALRAYEQPLERWWHHYHSISIKSVPQVTQITSYHTILFFEKAMARIEPLLGWCTCENFDAHQPHTEVFVVCLDGQCGRSKCVNLEEDFLLPLSIVSLWSGQLTELWINSWLWALYFCPKGWEEPTLYFCICIFLSDRTIGVGGTKEWNRIEKWLHNPIFMAR